MPNQLPNHVRMNQCFFSPLRSPIIPWSVKTKEKLLIETVPNSLGRPKQKIEGEEDPSYWCSLPRSLRHEGISFLSSIHVLCRKEKSLQCFPIYGTFFWLALPLPLGTKAGLLKMRERAKYFLNVEPMRISLTTFFDSLHDSVLVAHCESVN